MSQSVNPRSLAPGEGDAKRVAGQPDLVDTETEANKQRRKVQNRKNQRAHRKQCHPIKDSSSTELICFEGLRTREQDPGSVQASRPFRVERWRLDEEDDGPSLSTPSASTGTITTYVSRPARTHVNTSNFAPERAEVVQGRLPTAAVQTRTPLMPPSFAFPLSTDHLLRLIHYNVFRAFVSNKRTLNTRVPGQTGSRPLLTSCPLGGPYRDDTTNYPLNPNIPLSLVPTRLQRTRLHSSWLNLFPFPRLRDNLIRREGEYDHLDLLQDLIGELMGPPPARNQRGTPQAFTLADPNIVRTLPLTAGRDEDEITAGRKGLIVWGEPYDQQSWEVTPGFVAKWTWAVEGCDDLVQSSNRWRMMREDPMYVS